MAFHHGKETVFKVAAHADLTTPVDISAYLTSVGNPRSADTAETSTMGNTSKSYLAGLKDGSLSIEGNYDPTVAAQLEATLADRVAFEHGPAGSANGMPKYTGYAIQTSFETKAGVSDAVTFSAEFQIDGDVTVGSY